MPLRVRSSEGLGLGLLARAPALRGWPCIGAGYDAMHWWRLRRPGWLYSSCACTALAEDTIASRAQEPLTDCAIGSSGPKRLILSWLGLECPRRFRFAASDRFAALCAAFKLLTLKRAWFDGSGRFACMARSEA